MIDRKEDKGLLLPSNDQSEVIEDAGHRNNTLFEPRQTDCCDGDGYCNKGENQNDGIFSWMKLISASFNRKRFKSKKGRNRRHGHSSNAYFSSDDEDDKKKSHEFIIEPPLLETINESIFDAARLGHINRLKVLIEEEEINPNLPDEGNCTALHWASVNNHLEIVKYLIKECKVDNNYFGGDLKATPMHWAVRSGNYEIVKYLSSLGVPFTDFDAQGYACIHLAVHSKNVYMVMFLLYLGADINQKDSFGRTALMWACYLDKCIDCVQELVVQGAQLDIVDNTKFTALHWCLISNNINYCRPLLHAGCNYHMKDENGRLPLDWAKERGTFTKFIDLLIQESEIFYNKGGLIGQPEYDVSNVNYSKESKLKHRKSRMNKSRIELVNSFKKLNILLYSIPYILLFSIVGIFIIFPLIYGIILSGLLFYIIGYRFTRHILDITNINFSDSIILTSFPLALCSLVLINWFCILPSISYLLWWNFSFIIFFILSIYYLKLSCLSDPGYLPAFAIEGKVKEGYLENVKSIIFELVKNSKFDSRNFCRSCKNEKLIRSKHCKVCKRCVAEFDHHCPWVYNCVGKNNHREFMLFMLSLLLGAASYVRISYEYLQIIPANHDSSELYYEYGIVFSIYKTSSIIGMILSIINISWLFVLICLQSWQVFNNVTTNENANWYRLEYMVYPNDLKKPLDERRYYNQNNKGYLENTRIFIRNQRH